MTRRLTVDLPETDAARQAHAWLRQMADEDGRSMGQEVVFLIKEAAKIRGLTSDNEKESGKRITPQADGREAEPDPWRLHCEQCEETPVWAVLVKKGEPTVLLCARHMQQWEQEAKMVRWNELIVTNEDGHAATLGELVEAQDAGLALATIRDGQIAEWPGYYLSAPGEEPDWNTPHGAVDWTGFPL